MIPSRVLANNFVKDCSFKHRQPFHCLERLPCPFFKKKTSKLRKSTPLSKTNENPPLSMYFLSIIQLNNGQPNSTPVLNHMQRSILRFSLVMSSFNEIYNITISSLFFYICFPIFFVPSKFRKMILSNIISFPNILWELNIF